MTVWDGLDNEAYDREYSDRELVKRIGRYFATQKKRLAIVGLTMLAILAADLAQPLILSRGVGALAEMSSETTMLIVAGAVILTAIGSWVANLVRRRYTGRVIGDMVREMRDDAFKSAIGQDMAFYDEIAAGKVISRITSDTQDFAQMLVLVTDMFSQLALLVILLVVLVGIEWRLTLLLSLMIPMIFGAALAYRNLARRVSQQASRTSAAINSNIQESIAGISVAKNFRQEKRIYDDFLAVNKQAFRVYLRRGIILSMVYPTLHVLSGFSTASLLYFGAAAVVDHAISLAAWYLFLQSVYRFWDPLAAVAAFWSQFQAGLASAERIFALIDSPPAVQQIASESVPALRGEIKFDRMRFQYSPQEVVLPAFDLHIKAGETVALVGHTGAGKSSIARLVERFYEFQDGALLIDGRDIRTFNLAEYRRHLGVVSQTPFLFNDTVMNNIRYARPAATDTEIEEMAYRIGHGEWVETLPNGLQTVVGERGARLSMGQRQLVALTRVLVQAPSIFILDEATASIDLLTESQIQEALNMILSRSTAILIAHRLSTVRSADRIVVLRKGEIIEQGNHDALMEQGGHYAELYNTYFRHQSLEFLNSQARGA